MIKYYYTSITNRNLYIDDSNLLDYLGKNFPNIYTYYQENFIKNNIVSFDEYKSIRLSFYKIIEEAGLSPYLLLKKENGELREVNTNSPLGLSNIKNSKLKELTKEEMDILYTDAYIKRTNKYIYYPSFLDNNPIFDLDYGEEEKFKIIKKTN